MSIEQQANLKFLVQLDKTPSEALTLLQQIYGKNAMSCTRFLSGTSDSKRVVKISKMRQKVGDHQPVELMHTDNMW